MGYSALRLLDVADGRGPFARVLAFLDSVGRKRAWEAVALCHGQASPPQTASGRVDDAHDSNRQRRRARRRRMREGPLAAVAEGRRDVWLVEDATPPAAAAEALLSRACQQRAPLRIIVDAGGDVYLADLEAVACRLLAGPMPALFGVGEAAGASPDAMSRTLESVRERWAAALLTAVSAGVGCAIVRLAPLPRGVCPVAARGLLLGYPVCYCTHAPPPPPAGEEPPAATLFRRARRAATLALATSGGEWCAEGGAHAAEAVAQGSAALCDQQLVVAAAGDGHCYFQFTVPMAAWVASGVLRTQVGAWELAVRRRGWRVQRVVEAARTVVL